MQLRACNGPLRSPIPESDGIDADAIIAHFEEWRRVIWRSGTKLDFWGEVDDPRLLSALLIKMCGFFGGLLQAAARLGKPGEQAA